MKYRNRLKQNLSIFFDRTNRLWIYMNLFVAESQRKDETISDRKTVKAFSALS